jgi:hypothetical protein
MLDLSPKKAENLADDAGLCMIINYFVLVAPYDIAVLP